MDTYSRSGTVDGPMNKKCEKRSDTQTNRQTDKQSLQLYMYRR